MERMSGAQTKKRGPNSPNESEKTKVKPSQSSQSSQPSVGASALTMASVLSVMTGAFSGGGAAAAAAVPSDADESDEDTSSQKSVYPNEETNPRNVWEKSNLDESQVRSPKSQNEKKKLEPLFSCTQDGAMRDEIVVEILSKNKKKFTGTITPLEAKHEIYIKCLGYTNHDNFDGVRVNFKGKLIVTFKLIQPINIDELESVENFDFTRVSWANGKKFEDVIACKVKGIRYRPATAGPFDNEKINDGQRVVKIEGCEYRVPEDEILGWLSLYGDVISKLEEDVFRDETGANGNNRTGNYSVMMRLDRDIPQLLPMCGRRIKIYHAGITKLCTHCFGEHRKQHCQTVTKVPWIDYVRNFMDENDCIPIEFYGRWVELVQNAKESNFRSPHNSQNKTLTNFQNEPETENDNDNSQVLKQPAMEDQHTPGSSSGTESENKESQKTNVQTQEIGPEPTKEQFDIPTTTEAYERMVDRLATVGLDKWEVDKAIEAKTTKYNRACREHKKKISERKKADDLKKGKTTRRNSINKQ